MLQHEVGKHTPRRWGRFSAIVVSLIILTFATGYALLIRRSGSSVRADRQTGDETPRGPSTSRHSSGVPDRYKTNAAQEREIGLLAEISESEKSQHDIGTETALLFQPPRQTTDESSGQLKRYYDVWSEEEELVSATEKAKDNVLDVVENNGVDVRRLEVSCRPSACRYVFGFTALQQMAPLEHLPREGYEGRIVAGRGERMGSGDWVVVVYQVFRDDDDFPRDEGP